MEKGGEKVATIFERMKKIIIDQLGVDDEQVMPGVSFIDDLNADSLDLVELIMAMEEEFSDDSRQVRIPDEDAEGIKTVQDAMDYIKELGIEDG